MCKSRLALKLTPVLAACLLTQGCVGIFVARTKAETFKNPKIGDKPAMHAVQEAVSEMDSHTAAWLEDHWGKPTTVRPVSRETQGERWTYKFRPAWCGVIPSFVIPVPLLLPVASEKVVFFVRDGQVAGAEVARWHCSGVGASMFGPDSAPWNRGEW
jgi:hypothetical protein